MFNKLVLIGMAGAAGTLMRYGVSGAVHRFLGSNFPWGTFIVNISGCFLAGFLWILAEKSILINSSNRTIFFIGFLGAYTTFSSFMLETNQLIRDSEWLWAFKNILMNNLVGFIALFAGALVAGLIIKG